MADRLTPGQLDRVRRHAGNLADRVGAVRDLREYLQMHRREVGPCPLLEPDGGCGIYAVRPLSCRSLLSTRESRWCSADFSSLSRREKADYLESLDRSAVSYPTHYSRTVREAGEELEEAARRRMKKLFGFSVYGSFPVLLTLVRDHGITGACNAGPEAVRERCAAAGFGHPFLVEVDSGGSRG